MILEEEETPEETAKMRKKEGTEEMMEEETTEETIEKEMGEEMIEKKEEGTEEILRMKEEWIDLEIQGNPPHHQDFLGVPLEASLLLHQGDQGDR